MFDKALGVFAAFVSPLLMLLGIGGGLYQITGNYWVESSAASSSSAS